LATGVVDGDTIASFSSQELVDGLLCVLTQDIPQSNINRADSSNFSPRPTHKAAAIEHCAPMGFDMEGILPQQEFLCVHLLDHGASGVSMDVGFTQAYQTLIGMDSDPETSGELGYLEGFDFGNLHVLSKVFKIKLPTLKELEWEEEDGSILQDVVHAFPTQPICSIRRMILALAASAPDLKIRRESGWS
jgi:hypothetical protein